MTSNNKANLFLVGASKCGTTFLHDLLAQHPNIYMSKPKELFHFTKNNSHQNTNKYNEFFKDGKNLKYRGESTPAYLETTFFKDIPKKIYEYNNYSKIIILVRSPFARLESVYSQTLSTGHFKQEKYYPGQVMDMDFKHAVMNYPPFIEATKYWTHISNYQKYFSDKNIKVILFEDLIKNKDEVLMNLCNFLNLDQSYNFDYSAARKNPKSSKKIYSTLPKNIVTATPNKIRKFIPKKIQLFILKIIKRLFLKNIPLNIWEKKTKDEIHKIMLPEVTKLYEYLNIDDDPWSFNKYD